MTATFDIYLTSEPTADVTLGFSSSNTAEGTVAPATVTFTSTTWNQPQTVTVTGVDDLVADGDVTYQIITTPDNTTADTNYNKLNPDDVTVINTDNDSPGVTISQSNGNTAVTEGGVLDSYTIQLNTLPIADVQMSVTANPETEVSLDGLNFAAAQTLTFTAANGITPQTVTVRATDDSTAEGDHSRQHHPRHYHQCGSELSHHDDGW